MIKFNDEMLSRVLTAHENGGLQKKGRFNQLGYPGCLYQVALESDSFCDFIGEWDWKTDGRVLDWFDHNYDHNWTTDQFLQYLTNKGVA